MSGLAYYFVSRGLSDQISEIRAALIRDSLYRLRPLNQSPKGNLSKAHPVERKPSLFFSNLFRMRVASEAVLIVSGSSRWFI
jgi:hypothetical protein